METLNDEASGIVVAHSSGIEELGARVEFKGDGELGEVA